MHIQVECHAGHRNEDTPRRLVLGRGVAVEAVLDRWLAPDHRYFKVKGEDGAIYIVRHDVPTGRWEMVSFQADDGAAVSLRAARLGGPH